VEDAVEDAVEDDVPDGDSYGGGAEDDVELVEDEVNGELAVVDMTVDEEECVPTRM
jgi:hypothetical protein